MNSSQRLLLVVAALLTATALGLTALSLTSAQEEQEPEWTRVTLPGGPAFDLSAAPKPGDDEQVLYAAGREVLTSTRGTDWVLSPGTGPAANVLAASNGIVYATDLEGQGYRSTHYGRSWRKIYVREHAPVRFVAASPDYDFDGTAYAVIEGEWRLYRTTNDARSWHEVTPEIDVENQIAAVGFSPLHRIDETVFIGSQRGIYKWSADNRKWTMMSEPGEAPAFGDAGGPLSSQGLVIPYEYGDDPDRELDPVIETLFAYNAHGIYRSDDDGKTWRELDLPAKVEQVNGLAVSNGWPADPVIMVAAAGPGIVGVVSFDNGQSWSEVAAADGLIGTDVEMSIDFAPIPEPDEHWRSTIHLPVVAKHAVIGLPPVIVPPDIGSREAFIATDGGGVIYTDDGGATWHPSSPAFEAVTVTALDMMPGGPEADVIAGSQASGLFRSTDGGATWSLIDSGLPRGSGQLIYDVLVSPNFDTDDTVFVVAASGIWVSRDGGHRFEKLDSPPGALALDFSPQYATDKTLLTTGQISTDDGATWQPLPAITGTWTAVAFSPDWPDDETIWAGTTDVSSDHRYGLYRKVGDGKWETITDPSLSKAGILTLYTAKFDPGEDPRIFAGTTAGLIASFDNGEDFKRVGRSSRPVNDVTGRGLTVPFVRGVVLACGEDGAMWSTNRGVDYQRDPRSDKPARGAALSDDATVLLIGLSTAAERLVLEP